MCINEAYIQYTVCINRLLCDWPMRVPLLLTWHVSPPPVFARQMLIPLNRGKFPLEGGTVMGNSDDEEDDIAEFQRKIVSAKLPAHALKAAEKELKVLIKQVGTLCFSGFPSTSY